MTMGQNIKQEIYDYYNERAPEYEEIYTLGTGPASIPDPSVYRKEVKTVSKIISKYVGENHIDMACGTAFWLQFYHHKCLSITLVDQSSNMIEESRKKVEKFNILKKVEFICKDILNCKFKEQFYDSALAGLLLSHLDDNEENKLFEGLKLALKPGGNLILLDSVWTRERAKAREKSALQKRLLNNGREFTILKKYFTSKDIKNLFGKHKVDLKAVHSGRVFITGIGTV